MQLSAVVAEQPLPGMTVYTETGLATRPILGSSPVPEGLAPAAVARIVHAIEVGETTIPSTGF